jgi:hypothetical protein
MRLVSIDRHQQLETGKKERIDSRVVDGPLQPLIARGAADAWQTAFVVGFPGGLNSLIQREE